MSAGFESFDVPAGVGVSGRGTTLADAFGQTALGMFALIVDLGAVEEREVREVRAHAESLEALLVSWLNECLYVHDVEGFVARRVELSPIETGPRPGGEPFKLHGFLHGEEMDPSRHRPGTVIKAATPRDVSVLATPGSVETRVVIDL